MKYRVLPTGIETEPIEDGFGQKLSIESFKGNYWLHLGTNEMELTPAQLSELHDQIRLHRGEIVGIEVKEWKAP